MLINCGIIIPLRNTNPPNGGSRLRLSYAAVANPTGLRGAHLKQSLSGAPPVGLLFRGVRYDRKAVAGKVLSPC